MGHLNVIIIPKASTGNKTSQMLDVPLKPLNLHERVNNLGKEEVEKLLLTKIKIGGRFSVSDAYYWISHCIPDVPPNV